MSERDLIDGLARLARPVVPGDDPYGRLMHRHRRSRRVRAGGWATAAVVAVVAALLGPIGIRGSATPVIGGPSASERTWPDRIAFTPWVKKLVQTPTRGRLASDTAFLTELSDLLGRQGPPFDGPTQVAILFADDVENRRIVVAVRHDGTAGQAFFVSAPSGADAATLAAADERVERIEEPMRNYFDLRPYFGYSVGETSVTIVPAGCRIATMNLRAETPVWTDSPGGDYAISQLPSEGQRITCDGVVRYRGLRVSMGGYAGRDLTLSAAQLDAAVAGARGRFEAAVGRQEVQRAHRWQHAAPPRLLYMGPAPGVFDKSISVLLAPFKDGWWEVYAGNEDGGTAYVTSVDVGRPDAVVSIELDGLHGTGTVEEPHKWLVVAPPAAMKLQVVQGNRVVETVALTDGVGVAGERQGPLTLRALDASGRVVGTSKAPLGDESMAPLGGPELTDWF